MIQWLRISFPRQRMGVQSLVQEDPTWLGTTKPNKRSPHTGTKESPCTAIKTPAAAKSLQSCPTLCNPTDGSPPGSSVPGILQARILEWLAISLSNAWNWKVKVKSLSHVQLLATPWTTAYQAPPSMRFSRQEYWSGLSLPSPNKDPIWHKNSVENTYERSVKCLK